MKPTSNAQRRNFLLAAGLALLAAFDAFVAAGPALGLSALAAWRVAS